MILINPEKVSANAVVLILTISATVEIIVLGSQVAKKVIRESLFSLL